MGIFDRFRNRAREVSGVELMQQTGNSYYSWRGSVYESDIVRACMMPTVTSVGKLVGKHIRESVNEDGTRDIKTNPRTNIRFILEEPNPLMTGQQLQEKLATQLLLNSNAFALIRRDDYGNPMEIYPIIPRNVTALYGASGELQLKFTLQNSKEFIFPYTDIIHLRRNFNENDIFGTPIASALVPLLDVVTTTDQGMVNAIKNSSVVKWLLKFSNAMRPSDLTEQASEFAKNFLSTSNGVGVAAVDAKADAVQINPTDYVPNAQVMDRTTKRIFDLFRTNSAMVSGKYTEEDANAHFDSNVEPIEIQLNDEYTRKLFTRRERGQGNYIVFEASAWDSASIQTKLNLQAMVDRGALTPNEWRATFNLAPVLGGDTPIRRLDTAEITEEGGRTDED